MADCSCFLTSCSTQTGVFNNKDESWRSVLLLPFSVAHCKCDRKGGEQYHHEECDNEIDGPHGYGESIDNKVAAAHLDDAKALLDPAYGKSDKESANGTNDPYHHSFVEEGATNGFLFHSKALHGADIFTFIYNKQR